MSCNSLLSSTNADLVGYYSFNETSGTSVADNSGAGNNATASADMSTLTGTGEFGNCITLAGTNYAAATKSGGFASYPFSMGCRFKHDGTAAVRQAVAISDADNGAIYWTAGLSSVHFPSVFRRNSGTQYGGAVSGAVDTNWHTMLLVFPDATSLIAYIDGVETYNETGLDSVAASAAAVDMMVGDYRTTDATNQWIGLIDEPAFWTDEVSSTEAAEFAAGPEPIWLGTGTHHFNVARDIAYWNCPSSAWGLPTHYNAASTDNGALTAEVRIVRDRGKATEAVVATTTGFSGSVACAGSTDNLTLELRVSNDGGYDDSLGDDADGWVSVAWYGLEAKLVGQWNLDEQSGTVARNQVRTTAIDEDFTVAGTPDSSGDKPDGWSRWVLGYTPDANHQTTLNPDGTFNFYNLSDGAGTDYLGITKTIQTGKNCVAQIRFKVNSCGAGCDLRLGVVSGVWNVVANSSTATGVWTTATVNMGESSLTAFYLAASSTNGNSIDVDVDSVTLLYENAGTYDRDASNTYLSIADLGTIDGGQDFNGSSDEVTFGSRVTSGTLDELSAFAWVKSAAVSGSHVIASEFLATGSQRSWFMAYQTSSNILDIYISGDGGSSTIKRYQQAVDISDWTHVGFTFNRGTLYLYVDGVRQSPSTPTDASFTSIFDSSSTFEIGNRNGVSENFDGGITHARVYSRALTGPEIAQLYAQGPTALVDVGRVAHYLLEETSGTTVADSSASGNDGTATSDLSTLTTSGRVGRAVNLDNTDYISAPWSGGFTYPTSLACAFKLDTLTGATPRTLLSLADASDSSVYYMVAAKADGANIEVSRRNPTAIRTFTAATLTTNWHTAVLVFHDATSFSLYFDGTLLTTQTGLTSVSASANIDTLLIGLLRLSSPTQYADGITFDEVSAWNRELSAYDVMDWTRGVLSQRPSVFNMGLALGL